MRLEALVARAEMTLFLGGEFLQLIQRNLAQDFFIGSGEKHPVLVSTASSSFAIRCEPTLAQSCRRHSS